MANFGQWAEGRYDIQGCGRILFAGSTFYIGLLPNCATEAPVFTLTASAAAANAESISFTATSSDVSITTATVRKGNRLTFSGGDVAIVTADTVITVDGTASNTVPVQALAAGIAAAETATNWLLLEFQAPTDLPLASTDNVIDITDSAGGIQGAEQKTNVGLSISAQGWLTPNDPSIRYIHDASQSDVLVTAVTARTGNIFAIGKAIISNINYPGTVKDAVKLTFDVSMQPPYSFTPPADTWTAAEKTLMNTQLQLIGVPTIV